MKDFIKMVLILAAILLLTVLAYNVSITGYERTQAANDTLISLHKLEYPQNER